MNKLTLEDLAKQSVLAALYVVTTLSMGGLSYGPIQFRYSEILNLLAFFNPVNAIGVTLGVFISNFWSQLGMFDLVFGTMHTIISMIFITRSPNIYLASIWPTVFSFIIGYELSVLAGFGTFTEMTLAVMASEFVIMTLISIPVYKILSKNHTFLSVIGYNNSRQISF